jgi:hypothetical protein
MGYGISIWSSWISIRDICSLCLADDARHVIGCNGGQGESLVPSHTRGSLSLSLSLALYQRMPFNSRNEGTKFVPMTWRAISARPYRQGGGAEVKGDVPFALNPRRHRIPGVNSPNWLRRGATLPTVHCKPTFLS